MSLPLILPYEATRPKLLSKNQAPAYELITAQALDLKGWLSVAINDRREFIDGGLVQFKNI